MFSHPMQKKAYDAVAAALPFAIDPANITVRARSSCMTTQLPEVRRGQIQPHHERESCAIFRLFFRRRFPLATAVADC
jgi:hypothetical protein